jgi:hypothetical protein
VETRALATPTGDDLALLVGVFELGEDVAFLDRVALLDEDLRESAGQLGADLRRALGDDVAGGRDLHLGLRGRDERDLGGLHLLLEDLPFELGPHEVAGAADGSDDQHGHEDALQSRCAGAGGRRGRVPVDAERGEIGAELIVHSAPELARSRGRESGGRADGGEIS